MSASGMACVQSMASRSFSGTVSGEERQTDAASASVACAARGGSGRPAVTSSVSPLAVGAILDVSPSALALPACLVMPVKTAKSNCRPRSAGLAGAGAAGAVASSALLPGADDPTSMALVAAAGESIVDITPAVLTACTAAGKAARGPTPGDTETLLRPPRAVIASGEHGATTRLPPPRRTGATTEVLAAHPSEGAALTFAVAPMASAGDPTAVANVEPLRHAGTLRLPVPPVSTALLAAGAIAAATVRLPPHPGMAMDIPPLGRDARPGGRPQRPTVAKGQSGQGGGPGREGRDVPLPPRA
mmetsp:Transcript_77858/g.166968  ORF Transcript_77858/g.166968 Transcript_77858/m.166968 type:complete len:302 (+) Transcript_77858:1033-1938(+)